MREVPFHQMTCLRFDVPRKADALIQEQDSTPDQRLIQPMHTARLTKIRQKTLTHVKSSLPLRHLICTVL
jgi:hypothetical protein